MDSNVGDVYGWMDNLAIRSAVNLGVWDIDMVRHIVLFYYRSKCSVFM